MAINYSDSFDLDIRLMRSSNEGGGTGDRERGGGELIPPETAPIICTERCPTEFGECVTDTCLTDCNQPACHVTDDTDCNQNTCADTCATCNTACNQDTCATCNTDCGQDTCNTCNTDCGQDTCTCNTDCAQITCATCNTDCGQVTCNTCNTDCGQVTCNC